MSKTIQIVVILVIAIFNQSCSDDDFFIDNINETFVDGQWELINSTENGTAITLTDCDKMSTIEFIDSSDEAIIATYNLIADDCEMTTNSTETYTITINTLTITNNLVYEIRIENEQTLVLTSTQNDISVVDTYNRL
ncbi:MULTISPECIES: lipocalin family protein [Flavobacteriaceae]|jgi:hypothetical protein|uniref:lipocalin family protein n=1 Tax=Flavobacteriaceae TaxID=49546 RepID=UPI000C7DFCA1|nr:lipocalin family protein [Psychroflexus sp. MES1-P1E]PKG42726.1 hypothetical protein CXF67_08765 [Psychroflexus sp. MES1-P1E]